MTWRLFAAALCRAVAPDCSGRGGPGLLPIKPPPPCPRCCTHPGHGVDVDARVDEQQAHDAGVITPRRLLQREAADLQLEGGRKGRQP